MQETRVRSLVQEDPTGRGSTKSVLHKYWACALEPASPYDLEPVCPWAHAPQQEKPAQEAHTQKQRVAPTLRD